MLARYNYREFPYVQMPEQKSGQPTRRPVIVVGAGPIGLTTAIDLSLHDIPVLILDDNNKVSVGSRGLAWAKRPMEILDRLGVAKRILKKGASWQVGKVFLHDELIFEFNLLEEDHHKLPAVTNMQQYYLEEYLIDRCGQAQELIDLRWNHTVISVTNREDYVDIMVGTVDGVFHLESDWLIACDGANSPIRTMLDAKFVGESFEDHFLIADVEIKNSGFPQERRFWFMPTFHDGQTALLQKEPDDLWRIDFQLGPDIDKKEELKPKNVDRRLTGMLGEDTVFDVEWTSIYTFNCRRMESFRHGRILFAGDSAHQVSPFGARGANSGMQDSDNLAWKLAYVLSGKSPVKLIDSYCEERELAADDNIRKSSSSIDFMSPKSQVATGFRDAVLELSRDFECIRPFINSGRWSLPTPYVHSSLNTPDEDQFDGGIPPGTNCIDSPIEANGKKAWLIDYLGNRFVLLVYQGDGDNGRTSAENITCDIIYVGKDIIDRELILKERYDMRPGTTYLFRPDQYVAARWRKFDKNKIAPAILKAAGYD